MVDVGAWVTIMSGSSNGEEGRRIVRGGEGINIYAVTKIFCRASCVDTTGYLGPCGVSTGAMLSGCASKISVSNSAVPKAGVSTGTIAIQ